MHIPRTGLPIIGEATPVRVLPGFLLERTPPMRAEAKEKKWRRCPKCQVVIERIDGCDHMTCSSRCGFEFCYRCGAASTRPVCGNPCSPADEGVFEE